MTRCAATAPLHRVDSGAQGGPCARRRARLEGPRPRTNKLQAPTYSLSDLLYAQRPTPPEHPARLARRLALLRRLLESLLLAQAPRHLRLRPRRRSPRLRPGTHRVAKVRDRREHGEGGHEAAKAVIGVRREVEDRGRDPHEGVTWGVIVREGRRDGRVAAPASLAVEREGDGLRRVEVAEWVLARGAQVGVGEAQTEDRQKLDHPLKRAARSVLTVPSEKERGAPAH